MIRTGETGELPRLLIATDDLAGGTGSHLAGLLGILQRHWSIRVVCYGDVQVVLPPAVSLVQGPLGTWNHFPVAQFRRARHLTAEARTWRPDVLHTYFFWSVMCGRYLKHAGIVPRLVENREDQGFSLSGFDYRLLRATSRLPDHVICVSKAVSQVVLDRERLSQGQAVVVHNGLPLHTIEGARPPDEALRAELGIRPGEPVVGMVAKLNREVKGVRFFIEAIPLILREVPQTRFLVLGDGRLKPQLEAQVQELGVGDRVIFAGFREDISRFYPLMDISTLTSLSEGLSITILESMAFGLPVVATRVGGNPELVRHEETGLLVPPQNPPAFAEAVGNLLKDPSRCRIMGSNAREVVRSFDIESVADQYSGLYRVPVRRHLSGRAG